MNITTMRLLISGYRGFSNSNIIEEEMLKVLKEPYSEHTIIHGGCRGVDQIAGRIAKKYNMKEEIYVPDWKIGLKAGPLRNIAMVKSGADYAIVFLSPFSKGTKHMLSLLSDIPHTVVNV